VKKTRGAPGINVHMSPSMIDWIKLGIVKVVPQPELHGPSKTDGNDRTEAQASTKGVSWILY